MKKVKILIISIFVFTLTGCSFNYDLTITEDGISEVNTAWFNQDELIDNDVTQTVYKISSNYFINDDHLIANETNIVSDDNRYGYQTTNNYELNDISNLKSLNLCYNNTEVISTDKKVGLKTTKEFLCFDYYNELDEVTVHISSDLKCIDCNADEIKDNNYYWYINKDNANDKKIVAVFRKKYDTLKFVFPVICIIILIIGTLITTAILAKQKSVNKI